MGGAAQAGYRTRMESVIRLFFRQTWTEFAVACRTRRSFRDDRNENAVRAYCAMTEDEFEGINALQAWANWRVIPRNLRGRLPWRPCRAVDLCCGVGQSTEVLAHFLPPGSEILGLEFNPAFVERAARRAYRAADGTPARVRFRAQSVLEPFRDERGRRLEDGSMDLVNSCGALGIHFDAGALDALAGEIARVLRPGGLATVDSGRQGVRKGEMTRIFERHGFEARGSAKSCFLDRFTQLGLVKSSTGC